MSAEEARGECAKAAFSSKGQAEQSARHIAKINGDRKMHAYLCPTCHYYHLSSGNKIIRGRGRRRGKSTRTY